MSEEDKKDTLDREIEVVRRLFKLTTGVDVKVKVVNGEFIVTDPEGEDYRTGIVRKH